MTCHDVTRRCVEGGNLEGSEIRTLVFLTISFQTVFTAFNALQNLHSSLHDEESLGLVCLSVIYGTGIISSIFSPTLIGVAGAKLVLVLSFSAHCLYILSNFYPSFETMVPAAVVLGAFLGPSWTSQGVYISTCAFSFSKSSSASPYAILSRFNVFFFAVFATTQIVGNLVMSVVIRDGVGNSTEVDSFSFCGRDDCPANENATEITDPETWVLDITLVFFMACAGCGLCIVVFLLNSLPQTEWSAKVSVRTTVGSFFQVLVSPYMLMLVPFIMFTAMEHALLLGAFTKSYVACPIGIHMVGYVMAANGATTPVFLLLFTRLARLTGRSPLIVAALLIHLGLLVVLYDWVPTSTEEPAIFAIPIVWGVAESILQAQANALIALLFSDCKEAAFANYHFWRSVGYSVTFLNVAHLCVSTKIIIAMATVALGTVLYIVVEIWHKLEENRALKSTPPPEDGEATAGDVIERKLSKTSNILSDEDRQSFNIVELRDIIREAQTGWRKDSSGYHLEINKMMSAENLQGSKVTTWFHTRHSLDLEKADVQLTPSLQRSQSDGHLHSVLRHGKIVERSASHAAMATRKSWYGGNDFSSIPEDEGEVLESNLDVTEVTFDLGDFTGRRDSDESGILKYMVNRVFKRDSNDNSNTGDVFSVSYKKRTDSYLNHEFEVSPSVKSDTEISDSASSIVHQDKDSCAGHPRRDSSAGHPHRDSSVGQPNIDKSVVIEMPEPWGGNYKGQQQNIMKKSRSSPSLNGKHFNNNVSSEKKLSMKKSSKHNKKSKKESKVTRHESYLRNGSVVNQSIDVYNDDDSDGFVNDADMNDENDNEIFDDISTLSTRKKKAMVPKTFSEDVDNIY